MISFALLERIELTLREILDAGSEGKAQQMHGPKEHLAVAPGISGMNIAFDHVVMHQPIDDIVRLMFRRANDEGIRQEVAHVDEGIGTDPLVLAKVFKGVAGMERIHGHFKLLAIAGGVQQAIGLAIDLGSAKLSMNWTIRSLALWMLSSVK